MMRDIRQAAGLFFALLAIVAQLTLAATVPASAVTLADVTVLCQHDNTPSAPVAPPHHTPDCLVCFFCHAVPGPVALIATPPILPVPITVRTARMAILPPPTAPPSPQHPPSQPRAPPATS
jgi:hypothetical protein